MTESFPYVPALAGTKEVVPALSLHDPNIGWISAVYRDGTRKDVDLKTALLDAHLIDRVALDHTVATASLHRIMISIISSFYIDGLNGPSQTWLRNRSHLMGKNEGFDPELVNEYFDKWADRFYLIHPFYPFLQDPSLPQSYNPKELYDFTVPDMVEVARKNLSKTNVLSPIAASLQDGIRVKNAKTHEWGLPKLDVIDNSTSPARRIKFLFEALCFERYAHASIMRGARSFLNDQEILEQRKLMNADLIAEQMAGEANLEIKNDTHLSAQMIRAAINFIVDGGSLFNTLLLTLNNGPETNFTPITTNDVPEWEWDVNEYGFLGTRGKSVEWNDQLDSLDSVRSSINHSQAGVLFMPTLDASTGVSRGDAGSIKTLRRLLFNFKHNVGLVVEKKRGKDGEIREESVLRKMSFPVSWNPFIAISTKDGKALKQPFAISHETSLSRSSIFRIAMLPRNEDYHQPQPIQDLGDPLVDRAVRQNNENGANIRVLVNAVEITQDRSFNDFTLTSPDFSSAVDLNSAAKIEDWISFPIGEKGNIGPLLALRLAIKNAYASITDFPVSNKVDFTHYETTFWAEYTKLFHSKVTPTTITPVVELRGEITALTHRLFNLAVSGQELASPYVVAGARNMLNIQIAKKFRKEGK